MTKARNWTGAFFRVNSYAVTGPSIPLKRPPKRKSERQSISKLNKALKNPNETQPKVLWSLTSHVVA